MSTKAAPSAVPTPQDVVVLDDQENWLRFFERLNKDNRSKYNFYTFQSYHAALDYLKERKGRHSIFAVFVDVELSDEITGVDFIRMAKKDGLDLPYIVCTQYNQRELMRAGRDISTVLEDDAACFIAKDDLNFTAGKQNVDEVAELARHTYLERSFFYLRSYFEQSSRFIGQWREEISTAVANLDAGLILEACAPNAERIPDHARKLHAVLREARGTLEAIVGAMQVEHLLALQAALGKKPRVRRAAHSKRGTPDYGKVSPLYHALISAARDAKPNDDPATSDLVVQASTICRHADSLDASIALAKAIDDLDSSGGRSPSLALARAAASLFAQRRDVRREVMFNVVAADMLSRSGHKMDAEAIMGKARRLARSTGDASIQLELLQRTS
jgi:CheY-like chemotaxis protein